MKRNDKILNEMYVLAYKHAEPPADFEELLLNAPTNDEGRKVIDYMSYEISQDKLDEIFNDTMKKYKVNKRLQSSFAFSYYLGPTPKSKL
jgi:hypothetical protein